MTNRLKILIVEDDPITGKVYQRVLAKNGFDVLIAEDAETALSLYAAFQPNGLLLDYMLPGLNGIELFKMLRSRDTPHLPILVILYTSAYSARLVQEAIQVGIPQVLDKARTTPSQVVEIISTLLRHSPAVACLSAGA